MLSIILCNSFLFFLMKNGYDTPLLMSLAILNNNIFLNDLFPDEPYKSANHYWPLTKIEKKKEKIVKDECGKTNAKVSDGVRTTTDIQLGTVVSLNSKRDSLVMTPLKSRCISDPSYCELGITIEFWLRFRKGQSKFKFNLVFTLYSIGRYYDRRYYG